MKNQKELEELISEACREYQVGTPIMVDVDYDKLIETLKSEYPNSPLLKKAILEPTPKTRKRKLPILMASLEKVKSIEEIKDWIKSIEGEDLIFVISPKYDGCSIYRNELENTAITRGDGEYGQDVTSQLQQFDECRISGNTSSFGEAIISKVNWENHFKGKINPRSKQPYKSARNTVAGLLNNEEVQPELQYVDYVRYGIEDGLGDKNRQLSICATPYGVYKIYDLTQERLEELYQLWSKDYQIDGLVIDVNNGGIRESLSRLPNGNPRYAIAYKNPAWSGSHETIVNEIEFNVSKQGKLKPVILIETVDIDGVEVNRVTGYNAKYLIDNNIAEGSEIEITRSGDVIPKHLKTLSFNQDKVFELMDELTMCPKCGLQTVWDATLTEVICTNTHCCEGIQLSKLEHFFTTIGVEEFARPSIEYLFNKGFASIHLILNISKVELSSFEGWGEASANVVLNQFNRLKTVGVPVAKLLHACDVFEGVLGEKTAQLIIDNIDITSPLRVEDLIKIKGVATKTAEAFIKGMKEYEVRELDTLPILINQIESVKQEVKGDKFRGMKICFTGCRDKELEQQITEQWGEVVSGVSKTTTHLITANMEESTLSSSKAVKAKQLGVVIIDIESFKKL